MQVVWGVTEPDSPCQDRKRRERPPQVSPLFLISSEPSVYGVGFRAALPPSALFSWTRPPRHTPKSTLKISLMLLHPARLAVKIPHHGWGGACLVRCCHTVMTRTGTSSTMQEAWLENIGFRTETDNTRGEYTHCASDSPCQEVCSSKCTWSCSYAILEFI